ncbi:MAG TPA: hypothetical protein VF507_09150, partial [Pyrinomonadaceae bacterium]
KTGLQGLQVAVASGWVRGGVTGLGVLNLAMAFWEALHFRQTVRALQGHPSASPAATKDDAQPVKADPLSDYPRRDEGR